MKKWLRRIRGAVGMGLTWAAGWSGVGALIGLLMWVTSTVATGPGVTVFYMAFALAGVFAAAGFIGGTIFSTVLGVVEGRRRFDQMSLPRFAAWGALGGFLLTVFVQVSVGGPGLSIIAATVTTLLGAGSAAGSLALARRAEDRQLLEAGEEALGLTEG